jgi:hypothetical protein
MREIGKIKKNTPYVIRGGHKFYFFVNLPPNLGAGLISKGVFIPQGGDL